MSRWNRLGKHRACPVCGGERKDCRSLDRPNGITQYHCRTDNPNPDFELKKPDQLGFGIYFEKAELDAQSQQQKEDWIRQRRAEKKAREEREAKEYAEGLPVELRDREFRKVLSQLSLNPNHRADLERRGLTPKQIEKGMFRSVSKDGTFLNTLISQYLPGAWDWGKSFKSPVDGYLCPILNDNGSIIGCQVRVDGGGYVWLKTKKSSHLQNGELPITAHITEGDKNLRLVEGILKPQVAHCRRGQTYIGAAGGNLASSPQQLKQYIDYVQPQKIILCPDAGSRANKNVLRQYRAIAKLLKSWGLTLWVEVWGQSDNKGNRDVDEIDPNTETKIIPFDEWDINPTTKQYIDKQTPESKAEAEQQKNEWYQRRLGEIVAKQKSYNTCSLTPDIILNCSVFPDELWKQVPLDNRIVIADSFKGSGKSQHFLKPLVQYLVSQGKKIIFIAPRRTLAMALAESLGGTFQDDAPTTDEGMKKIKILCCCWDSLDKFSKYHWDFIGVDESRGGFKHLCEAKTEIKNKRPRILADFDKITKKALNAGGSLFLADADTSNVDTDYAKALALPTTKICYIRNDAKPKPKKAEIVVGGESNKKALRKLINEYAFLLNNQLFKAVEQVKAENPIMIEHSEEFKPLVWQKLLELGDELKLFNLTSDSQSDLESIIKTLVDKYPLLEYYCVRIDKKTSEENWAKEFIKNIDGYIEENCILVWSWSPSLMVGVSQQLPRFKLGFFIYTGVIEPCEFRQQMLRSRPCEYWYGWVAKKSNHAPTDFDDWDADQIKTAFLDKYIGTVEDKNLIQIYSQICQYEAAKQTENAEDLDRLNDYFNQITARQTAADYLNNPHIDLLAKVKARSNYNRAHCGEIFLQEIVDKENFELINPTFLDTDEDDGINKAIKEKKEEIRVEDAELMQLGALMTEDEMIEIADSRLHKNQTKIAGYKIANSLPGFQTDTNYFLEWVVKDRHWRKAQQLYFLATHPSIAFNLEAEELASHTLKWFYSGVTFLPDVKHQDKPVKLLQEIGLIKDNKLVLLDQPYTKESVKHIHAKAKKLSKQFKQYFNIRIGDEPITTIHSILDKLGVEHRAVSRKHENRIYEIVTLEKFLKSSPEFTPADLSREAIAKAEAAQQKLNKLIYGQAMQQAWTQKYWDKMAIEEKPIYGEYQDIYTTDTNCSTEREGAHNHLVFNNQRELSAPSQSHAIHESQPISKSKKSEPKINQNNSKCPAGSNTKKASLPEASIAKVATEINVQPIDNTPEPELISKHPSQLKIKDCIDALVNGVLKRCDIVGIDPIKQVFEVLSGFPKKLAIVDFKDVIKQWDYSGGNIRSVPIA
ncbi:MAG: hypothetical protein AAGA80_05255 [Cyanobacteria bacterium P01_F01_bin.143]